MGWFGGKTHHLREIPMLTHQWLQQAHQRSGEKWKEASVFLMKKTCWLIVFFLGGEKDAERHFFGSEELKSWSNHYTGGGTSIPCSVSKLVMMLQWWVIDFFRNQGPGPCTNTRKSSQQNWERKKYWTSKIVFVCFFVSLFISLSLRPWNSFCNSFKSSINFSPSKLPVLDPNRWFWTAGPSFRWKRGKPKRRSTRMSQEVSTRLVNGL